MVASRSRWPGATSKNHERVAAYCPGWPSPPLTDVVNDPGTGTRERVTIGTAEREVPLSSTRDCVASPGVGGVTTVRGTVIDPWAGTVVDTACVVRCVHVDTAACSEPV